MVIMKFGGTSVADAAAIRRVVAIVARARARGCGASGPTGAPLLPRGDSQGPIVVVSALAGVTDRLLEMAALVESGEVGAAGRAVEDLHERHLDAATAVGEAARRDALRQAIDRDCAELGGLVRALGVVREVSPRSLDALAATGEILSSRILAAALVDAGVPAIWIDARRVVVTDAEHTKAAPLMDETAARVEAEARPLLVAGQMPVLGGFVGATRHGITTTLGRGGSDYSAALVGGSLGADEIQIWTDVDGMLTADPRIVRAARLVPQLSFAEASELAYFGAKVLHPSTILPAVARGIPVRILNSRRPETTGTLIAAAPAASGDPLTAIASKRDVTVIDITSSRMLMAYGFLGRLFEVFERFKIAVDVVTTSEVSVSVTIDDRRRLTPLIEALSSFAEVSCEHDMALICAVGENLRSDPTLSARVLSALDGIGLRMVSQAASRRNITCVLKDVDLPLALTRLHDRFFGATPTIAGVYEATAATES